MLVTAFVLSLGLGGPSISLERCPAATLALPHDIEKVKAAVLTVSGSDDRFGSAVIIDPQGIALTAAHVVGDAKKVEVRFVTGLQVHAEVVFVDTDRDIAILDVVGSGHACLSPVQDAPKPGTDVFAIGSPASKELAFSISKGVVAGYPTIKGTSFLQTDASLNAGNSGGPMLTAEGQVAAIVSWKVGGGGFEGLGFGVPMAVFRSTLAAPKDENAAAKDEPKPAPASITFESPEPVTIAVLGGAEVRTAYTQHGSFSFLGTGAEDLCITPCKKALEPKVYTFRSYGHDIESIVHKVELRPGETRTFKIESRSESGRTTGLLLGSIGLSSAFTGGLMWAIAGSDSESPLGGPGVKALAVGGAAVWLLSLAMSSDEGKWTEKSAP